MLESGNLEKKMKLLKFHEKIREDAKDKCDEVDAENFDSEFSLSEYTEDIHDFLRRTEGTYLPKPEYM